MHLGATPISGGPFASARASADLGSPPKIDRNRADLGSYMLESADLGCRADLAHAHRPDLSGPPALVSRRTFPRYATYKPGLAGIAAPSTIYCPVCRWYRPRHQLGWHNGGPPQPVLYTQD